MAETILLAICVWMILSWLALTWAVQRAMGALPIVAAPDKLPEIPESGPDGGPLLTVIVPARDEEAALEEAMRSILAQKGVDFEVILVNDHSTDRTGEIADRLAGEDPRLRVMHDPDLPPGWLGKNNAMHQAAAMARGRYILFTDADIIHRPGAFAAGIAEMRRLDAHLLSLLPASGWVTVFENAIVPGFFVGAITLAVGRVGDPRSEEAAAAGAYILVRADTYRALGGHERIRNAVLDDVQLARLIKHSGHAIALRGAPDLVYCRMYRGNREAFWAFSKNILDALPGKPWWFILFVWPVHLAMVTGGVAMMGAGAAIGSWPVFLGGAGFHLLQYTTFYVMRRYMTFSPLRALLFPVSALSMTACLARALYYRVARGSVVWRGREVALGDPDDTSP